MIEDEDGTKSAERKNTCARRRALFHERITKNHNTMSNYMSPEGVNPFSANVEDIEIQEWLDSLEYVLKHGTREQAQKILAQLQIRAQEAGVTLATTLAQPKRY